MATGRTHVKFARAYIDGYDMSGYTRSFGPLDSTYDEGMDDALTVYVKGAMPGNAVVSIGALSGLFDNTATSGLHVITNSSGVQRNVMFPIGVQGIPADNDPAFACQPLQLAYTGNPAINPVTASIQFGNMSHTGDALAYVNHWGVLLLAKTAKTAANSATGLDQLAASTKGGWMMYHVFAGNGTAAIKVQDADTNSNGSFGDLLSSGTIDCANPISGVEALASTASVKRYVRWQIALGTATSVTLALSWHRGV